MLQTHTNNRTNYSSRVETVGRTQGKVKEIGREMKYRVSDFVTLNELLVGTLQTA
jgi:hypothetical protein